MEMQKYLGFMLGRVGFLTLVRKGLGCFGDSFGAEKTFWFLFPTASIGEMALGCALHAGSCSRALPQGSSWGTGRWCWLPMELGWRAVGMGGGSPAFRQPTRPVQIAFRRSRRKRAVRMCLEFDRKLAA